MNGNQISQARQCTFGRQLSLRCATLFSAPGCNAQLVFHWAAEALDVYSQSPESVQCCQSAKSVECNDMCEHAAERECLGRIAQRIDEGVIPSPAIPHIR